MTDTLGELARPIAQRKRAFLPTFVFAGVSAAFVFVGIGSIERSGAGSVVARERTELVGPLVILLVVAVFVAERTRPAIPRRLAARGHVQDTLYLVLYAGVVVPLIAYLSTGFVILIRRAAPGLVLPHTSFVPKWVIVAVSLLAIDGANWAIHLANHKNPPLWRLHALHHSQEEMSVLTSFRAHPLVHLSFVAASLPAFVLSANGAVPYIVFSFYAGYSAFTHANLNWTFGRLGKILVSPAYHRLHHASEGRVDVNLGTVITLWDVLSSRATFPRPAAAQRTGLAERPVPVEQATPRPHPFRIFVLQMTDPFVTTEPRRARRAVGARRARSRAANAASLARTHRPH